MLASRPRLPGASPGGGCLSQPAGLVVLALCRTVSDICAFLQHLTQVPAASRIKMTNTHLIELVLALNVGAEVEIPKEAFNPAFSDYVALRLALKAQPCLAMSVSGIGGVLFTIPGDRQGAFVRAFLC